MVLTRNLIAILSLAATLGAFARGAITDSADYWTRKDKADAHARSVLEKGYVSPEAKKSHRTVGADDADLLLDLLAAEVAAETAPRTNAVKQAKTEKSKQAAKPVVIEKIVEKPVTVEKVVTVEKPVTNTVEVVKIQKVDRPVTNVVERVVEKPVEKIVTVERPVTNVVERIVEKPVEVEKIVTVEKQVTNTVEVVKVERVEVERPVTNVVEKIVEVEKPVDRIVEVEKQITNVVEKVVTVEKPVEKIVEREVTNTVEKIVEKPVEVEKIVTVEKRITNIVEKIVEVEKPVIVERTNVVEKVVYDRGMEIKLAKEKEALERRGGALEVRNAGLEKRNDELKRELEEERAKRERLERAVPGAAKKKAKTGRPARITSKETYYDRKKGVAFFKDQVHVDDESYQLHADEAYVFTATSNDVRRIVAIGHVAMTNEARRAYGDKVSYYRQDGMVVLYAGNGVTAEVRDESKAEDQTIRGSKIKFWIDNEQVEVLDATISAPTDGAGMDIKVMR